MGRQRIVQKIDPVSRRDATAPTRPHGRRRRSAGLDESSLALALPFHTVELAATGGMALIYRAYDRGFRGPVAVKVLRPELAVHARSVDTFAAEYDVLRRVHHPGIVRIFDLGYVARVPYLVMDWIDGQTLATLVDDGPLAGHGAAAIGAQIARALAAVHEVGIVHCDVKPDNVMVAHRRDGDPLRVQLIDFGVARLPAPTKPVHLVTGTPVYMAPEQWHGTPEAASDVYALGCVLYELLTGAPPFAGSYAEVMTAHMERAPEPIRRWRPDVPKVLEDQVLAMLAKAPAARPGPTSNVARWLDELAGDLEKRAAAA